MAPRGSGHIEAAKGGLQVRDAKLWIGLGLVAVLSFSVLGYYGREIYHQSPPIPERVVTPDGTVVFSKQDILDGQNV
jgi:nitric oxide reductase subunit B